MASIGLGLNVLRLPLRKLKSTSSTSVEVIVQQWHMNIPLQWRHNGRDGVSNQQRFDGLLNRLFMHRSNKISKLRVTGLCDGNPLLTDGSPHKGPVTRKKFLFDDVIMSWVMPDEIYIFLSDSCVNNSIQATSIITHMYRISQS